jgi:hypothetical protein
MFPAWLAAASDSFKIVFFIAALALFIVLINYLGKNSMKVNG